MDPPTRLVLTFALVAVASFLPLSQGLQIDVRNFGRNSTEHACLFISEQGLATRLTQHNLYVILFLS